MTMGVYTMEMPTFNTLATSCRSEESTKIYGYERIWSILTNKRASRRRIIEKTKMGIFICGCGRNFKRGFVNVPEKYI